MNRKQYEREMRRFLKAQRRRVSGDLNDGQWRRAKIRWARARYFYQNNSGWLRMHGMWAR